MQFQVVGVTQPLASAGGAASEGRRALLDDDDDDAYKHLKATGKNIKLHTQGSVLIMRMMILAPGEDNVCRDRFDVKVSGEVGLTRQEYD